MSANSFQFDGCLKLACAICESAFVDYVRAKRFLRKFKDFEVLEKVEYYRRYMMAKNYCEKVSKLKKPNEKQKAKIRQFKMMKAPKSKPTYAEFERAAKYWNAQQTIYDCIRFWRSEYFINITLGQGDYNAVIERAEKEVLR